MRRQTIKKRLRNKLQAVRQELRKRWHERIAVTGEWLRSVVQGHFNYHAVPGNFRALQTFRREVARSWLASQSAESASVGAVCSNEKLLNSDSNSIFSFYQPLHFHVARPPFQVAGAIVF